MRCFCVLLLFFLVACSSEPDNEWDRFLTEYDNKVEVLFDHIDNPMDVEKGEFTALTSAGQVTQETRFLRYERIGPAAEDVLGHFTRPTMTFYLTLSGAREVNSDWKAALELRHETARSGLAARLKRFRETMPQDPPRAKEYSEMGQALDDVCGPGGVYSLSPMCGNKYGYTADDELYFDVEGEGLLIERILEFTIDDWLASVLAAGE